MPYVRSRAPRPDRVAGFKGFQAFQGFGMTARAFGQCPDCRHWGQDCHCDPYLAVFTVTDAETILDRPLRAGEARAIRKTLEYALADEFHDAILSHASDQ